MRRKRRKVGGGYEEGNPPRVRRLASRGGSRCSGALPAPPPPLFATWVPGRFRGSRCSRAGVPITRVLLGAQSWCRAGGWHLSPSGGRARRLRW